MKQKILYIYLLLQPFIDLITALMTRNEMSLTLGIVVRMIALGVIIFYTLISKSKYKKYAIGYYLLMFIFLIFYFLTKDLNMVFFKEELRFIFKYNSDFLHVNLNLKEFSQHFSKIFSLLSSSFCYN